MTERPLTCSNFDGPCCDSCHEDHRHGLDLIEVSKGDGSLFAVVCCDKAKAAYAAMEAADGESKIGGDA